MAAAQKENPPKPSSFFGEILGLTLTCLTCFLKKTKITPKPRPSNPPAVKPPPALNTGKKELTTSKPYSMLKEVERLLTFYPTKKVFETFRKEHPGVGEYTLKDNLKHFRKGDDEVLKTRAATVLEQIKTRTQATRQKSKREPSVDERPASKKNLPVKNVITVSSPSSRSRDIFGLQATKEVVKVSAMRTPIGCFLGALSEMPVIELGALAIRAAITKAGLNPDQIEEVYIV